MSKLLDSYSVQFLILYSTLIVLGLITEHLVEIVEFHFFWWVNVVILAGTLISKKLLAAAWASAAKSFVVLVIASTVIRLLIFIFFMVVVVLFGNQPYLQDVIYFGVFYLVLTVFEVSKAASNPAS